MVNTMVNMIGRTFGPSLDRTFSNLNSQGEDN